MMSQSWMGTDFTNDDLVKESSIVEDYTHMLAGDTVISGRTCHKVALTPKPDAAVVWGKVVLWVDQKDYLMLRAEYYDEYGAHDAQGGMTTDTSLNQINLDLVYCNKMQVYMKPYSNIDEYVCNDIDDLLKIERHSSDIVKEISLVHMKKENKEYGNTVILNRINVYV